MLIGISNEVIKIFFEMAPYMMIGLFFVGLLHILFSKEFVLKHVGEDNIMSTIKASVLGVPLPLCSCGVIPTAVFMAKNGASKGAIISFLISTPQTGIDNIIATYGMLGWVFAIYRPFVAFFGGIIGGIMVNLFANDDLKLDVEDEKESSCSGECCDSSGETKLDIPKNRAKKMYNYAFKEFLDDIGIHLLIGILISGLISYFLPAELVAKYNLDDGIIAMLVMIVAGIPMYICATASIPIAVTLMLKGVSPGVAFVFLSVGPLTNAASLSILSKIMTKKILAIYVGVTSILAMIFGWILNSIYSFYKLPLPDLSLGGPEDSSLWGLISKILSYVFLVMMLLSIYRVVKRKIK
ncbi:MAG: SO_0444 family Cu/Zn efflux transporter [Fusobacteriota bacterium]